MSTNTVIYKFVSDRSDTYVRDKAYIESALAELQMIGAVTVFDDASRTITVEFTPYAWAPPE